MVKEKTKAEIYSEQRRKLVKEKHEIERQIESLQETYIQENKKFNRGDKVLVTYEGGSFDIGFVMSDFVMDDGEIIPRLNKCKLNGEQSDHRLRVEWERKPVFSLYK